MGISLITIISHPAGAGLGSAVMRVTARTPGRFASVRLTRRRMTMRLSAGGSAFKRKALAIFFNIRFQAPRLARG